MVLRKSNLSFLELGAAKSLERIAQRPFSGSQDLVLPRDLGYMKTESLAAQGSQPRI